MLLVLVNQPQCAESQAFIRNPKANDIFVQARREGVTGMKAFRLTRGITLILAIFLFPPCVNATTTSAAQENHCFTCHASARMLIKITREIAQLNKDKPGASAETSGEG